VTVAVDDALGAMSPGNCGNIAPLVDSRHAEISTTRVTPHHTIAGQINRRRIAKALLPDDGEALSIRADPLSQLTVQTRVEEEMETVSILQPPLAGLTPVSNAARHLNWTF